ncbi:hypothetical protein D3C78_1960620 [compost metagenome]
MLHTGEFDRPGVVHQCIDAAEMIVGLSQCLAYGVFITHIDLQGQSLAARCFDFRCDAVNGPG